MAEERKHAILFAATPLSARKIIVALDSSKPNPGKDFFIDDAIKEAAATVEKMEQSPRPIKKRRHIQSLSERSRSRVPLHSDAFRSQSRRR